MDVDEIGAVGTPEGFVVEGGEEFVESAVVGGAFGVFGGDGDEAAFDGCENQIAGIDEEHALLGADEHFGGLRRGGLRSGELVDELFESIGGAGLGFDFAFYFLNGFREAGFIEGLEDVVDGVNIEGLDGIVVEGGGEDDVRDFEFPFDEFLEDAETVEAGHLDVEENEVGGVFLDEVDGVEAVFALSQEVNFGEGFEEKREFLTRGFFVVDDNGVDGHLGGQVKYSAGSLEVASDEWRLGSIGRRMVVRAISEKTGTFDTEDTER
jgi:hypothetical protein